MSLIWIVILIIGYYMGAEIPFEAIYVFCLLYIGDSIRKTDRK